MMKKILMIGLLLGASVWELMAQPKRLDYKFVTFNGDSTVTIQFKAPQTAKSVQIGGDFLPYKLVTHPYYGTHEEFPPQEMTKGADGIWSYRSGILKADLYKYYFIVDGTPCLDNNNLYVMRGAGRGTPADEHYFITPYGVAENYIEQNVQHGTVSARWYYSEHFKENRRMIVYTPAGYETSSDNYPVLYVLHGSSEREDAWVEQGRVVQIMDNLIAQGKCKPMIVVMPNGDVESQAAYQLMNFDNSQQPDGCDVQHRAAKNPNIDYYEYERYFPEIIKFIDTNYRTVANKANRAICGVSMGGRNAMNVPRLNRNTIGWVGLFSPALEPQIHFPNKKYDDEIINSLRQEAQDGVNLYWIGVGPHDLQWKTNQPFRAILDKVGMKYRFNPSQGAHTYNNWRIYFIDFASRLFK